MKSKFYSRFHALGPTICAPHPKVLKKITQEIDAEGIVSAHELRVARRMGLIATTPITRLGFNDGIVYPYEQTPGAAARALTSPAKALAPVAPKKRQMHALALLVDFSDNRGVRPAKDFEKLLFDKSNPKSMTNFYRELSYGALELTGEVVGYVRAPQPYSYYTASESGTGTDFPHNTPGLLDDALTIFCQTDNLKRFDTDQDGFVDGIFLIHAGGGADNDPVDLTDPMGLQGNIWQDGNQMDALYNKTMSEMHRAMMDNNPSAGAIGIGTAGYQAWSALGGFAIAMQQAMGKGEFKIGATPISVGRGGIGASGSVFTIEFRCSDCTQYRGYALNQEIGDLRSDTKWSNFRPDTAHPLTNQQSTRHGIKATDQAGKWELGRRPGSGLRAYNAVEHFDKFGQRMRTSAFGIGQDGSRTFIGSHTWSAIYQEGHYPRYEGIGGWFPAIGY